MIKTLLDCFVAVEHISNQRMVVTAKTAEEHVTQVQKPNHRYTRFRATLVDRWAQTWFRFRCNFMAIISCLLLLWHARVSAVLLPVGMLSLSSSPCHVVIARYHFSKQRENNHATKLGSCSSSSTHTRTIIAILRI